MCCSACFRSVFLSDFVDRNSDLRGECPFCGQKDCSLLAPEKIAPYLELLLEPYVASSGGDFLWDLLQNDWGIFSKETDRQRLVSEALGVISQPRYIPRVVQVASLEEKWPILRHELQSVNRFFPQHAPPKDVFAVMLGNLESYSLPKYFYRARTMLADQPHAVDKMGAPPSSDASGGRANPPGISYMYLADGAETAVAEVKPSKGSRVCVAEFVVDGDANLRVVDLTNPRATISPFSLRGGSLSDVRASLAFLELLGNELSVPTQPHRASLDYIATQYLCELIKQLGYDGVSYKSSLAVGTNFAFFNPQQFVATGQLSVIAVTDVVITSVVQQIVSERSSA